LLWILKGLFHRRIQQLLRGIKRLGPIFNLLDQANLYKGFQFVLSFLSSFYAKYITL
jgi:hypothetical protein